MKDLENILYPNKFDYDIDVDEDGLMWLVEEDDWKSAAKNAAMSDMKDEYTDDTETASKVWHSKPGLYKPVVRR